MQPCSRSRSSSSRRPTWSRTLLAAAIALPGADLSAQWSSKPAINNFVGDNCPLWPASFRAILALDPVMTPCNNGCFYVWVDPAGDVNIQIINDCGNRVLATPHKISHGFGPLALPGQIAGCEYDDPSTVEKETNQMFLAYTQIVGGVERLMGNVFAFDGTTIVPGAPCTLRTCAGINCIVTPAVDSSVDTFGENGHINGAVVGWREWDYFGSSPGLVTLGFDLIQGTAAAPTSAGGSWPYLGTPPMNFPLNVSPGRLKIVSDHDSGLFAGWRGPRVGNPPYYYQGVHVDSSVVATLTAQTPTARTTDDWLLAADLQGGAYAAAINDAETQLNVSHMDAANVMTPVGVAALLSGGQIHELYGMVGIDAPTGSPPAMTRAALAFRDGWDIHLLELTHAGGIAAVLPGTNDVPLGPISALASSAGSAVLGHRGVAVGWIEYEGRGNSRLLYGEEVDVHAATWATRWRKKPGVKVVVSRNDSQSTPPLGDKGMPLVVPKHTLPEVIFGWVDTRGPENDWLGHRGATVPGAYVQSVADDFWTFIGFPGGFRRTNGALGSNVWCVVIDWFTDLRGVVLLGGNPGDPFDPVAGVGSELLRVGPDTGTLELVKDINPGPAGSDVSRPIARGSKYLFSATTTSGGREPWVTDGTDAGTMQLADCAAGAASSAPQWIDTSVEFGPLLPMFSANNSVTGRELWRTDGTPAGTAMIVDLRPGTASGVVSSSLAVRGGRLYFWGNDGVSGTELWRTDGTAAGTAMVADLSPGTASTGVGALAAAPFGPLVFSANVSGLGAEPYVVDPLTGAATLLGDLAPGATSSSPLGLQAIGNGVYFSANTAAGREPWFTDGGSVFQIADINPTGSSTPSHFTAAGDYVLFTANNGSNGVELWRTDGSAAGTTMVADIAPGSASSSPFAITPIGNGRCVFTATDGVAGREPWMTDGTAAGTIRLADVNPGAAGSNPQHYDIVDGQLWLDALIDGTQTVVHVELAGPARLGQGCQGQFGVPRIGAPTGSPQLGQTFQVSLSNAAPNTIAALVYSSTSHPTAIGDCTLHVDLPELGMLLAFTDGAGNANVSIPIPSLPDLLGETVFLQWAVIDPTGALFGSFALSDALRATVE